MRLTAEQVKQSILHGDREIRDAAIYYFSKSFSPDPAIMPLVIQVIEQEGWKDAFESYCFIEDLVQTDETVQWLAGQIKQVADLEGDDADRYSRAITKGLVHADVNVLRRHEEQLINLKELYDESQFAIHQRIQFSTELPDELWDHLTFFCNRSDHLTEIPDDLDAAYHLAEALRRHPEFTIQKILPILSGETDDSGMWIELFAVRLAGELKLHNAVPQIVKLLETADDWMFEECERALVKIAGDEVVEGLAGTFPSCGFGFRIVTAAIRENIHTDLSVQTCLRLYAGEEDEVVKCSLLQSALMNFSTEAIEPARQFILSTSLSPEVLEVRTDLLVACKLMGEKFPEFDEWVEDSKNDPEFRRNWYRNNPQFSKLLEYVDELDEDEEEDDVPLPPRETIMREVRVGRNDPCPCGSGKKFKKCCLGKSHSV
jgi:hypothetical protein